MTRHAHAKEDKEARRDDILAAGLSLFLEDPRRFPSVASIAARAGLAKGTIYLYFETKEQIFSALLSREWHALLAHVEESFIDGSENKDAMIAQFIDRFATFLHGHPYFLRLDSLGYALMEANLSPDEFWRFKQDFLAVLDRVGGVVDVALSFTAGRGLRLLVRSYGLTRGLWQTLDFPERLRNDERFADDPLAQIDFDADIRDALREYWRGAVHE
jgi:AcrR family transcriptional regulator